MFYLKPAANILQKLDSSYIFFPEREIAADWASRDIYEKSLINWVRDQCINEKSECIDIGAHCGTYTLEMARKAKHVHSFECSPKTFNYLCANLALRGLHDVVTPYNVALGASCGKTPYYIRSTDGGGNGCTAFQKDARTGTPSIELPIRTLDSYNFTGVNFIKLDVEGHEQQVIEGGKKMLEENDYPTILFESWTPDMEQQGIPAITLRKNLFETIESLEYKIRTIAGYSQMFIAGR